MSPSLTGPQWELICPECETMFRVHTMGRMPTYAVCPCCSFAEVASSSREPCRGTRLFVRKDNAGIRPPERFDLILFRHPDHSQERVVKRIIGLPGETVSIENGNLFINGEICHKPLLVQKQQREKIPYGRWEKEGDTRVYLPEKPVPYTRSLFLESEGQKTSRIWGITNESPKNQWLQHQSANTHQMKELMLELDWNFSRQEHLDLTVYEKFHIRFFVHTKMKRCTVFEDSTCLAENRLPNTFSFFSPTVKITVSLFDEHLLVAVNDNIVYCEPISLESLDVKAIPFRIAGEYLPHPHPVVYRDIYYTARPDSWNGDSQLKEMTIPEACYFCIGDNCRFSEDSRVWKEPFLSKENVIGSVFVRPR